MCLILCIHQRVKIHLIYEAVNHLRKTCFNKNLKRLDWKSRNLERTHRGRNRINRNLIWLNQNRNLSNKMLKLNSRWRGKRKTQKMKFLRVRKPSNKPSLKHISVDRGCCCITSPRKVTRECRDDELLCFLRRKAKAEEALSRKWLNYFVKFKKNCRCLV